MEGATIRSAAFYGCRLAGCPCGKAAPSKVGRRAGGPPAKPPRPPQLPQALPFPATLSAVAEGGADAYRTSHPTLHDGSGREPFTRSPCWARVSDPARLRTVRSPEA